MTSLSLEPPVYSFSGILYSPTSGVIELNKERTQLRAREANLFTALIDSFPEVLSRKEIEARLWKDSYATNATINQTVKALRFSLKDENRSLIRTIPKQGYVLSSKPALLVDELNLTAPPSFPDNTCEELPVRKRQKPTRIFSAYFLCLTFLLGGASYLVAANGLLSDKIERVSQQYKGNWVLFNAEQQELEQLPFFNINQTQYVLKEKDNYLICYQSNQELECKSAY